MVHSLAAKIISTKSAVLVALAIGGGFFYLSTSSDREILIESKESKTAGGQPVFNRIKKTKAGDKTIWTMNQSHDGVNAPPEKWERLKIELVEINGKKTASFEQLDPGSLQLNGKEFREPLRVACYLCHANGPRAIRPNYDSKLAPINLADRLQIAIWNLEIKIAGRVVLDSHIPIGKTPVKFSGSFPEQPLEVATCRKCHGGTGIFAREPLQKQHFMAIRHLVSTGAMPPIGHKLSSEEKLAIEKFADM